MRRAARIASLVTGAIVALPVLLVMAVVGVANLDSGRRLIEQMTPALTGDTVRINGIGGRFPDALRVARIELRDQRGPWLTVSDAALDWSPLALLTGLASVDLLSAQNVTVTREPLPSGSSQAGTFGVPVRVAVRRLQITELNLAQPIAGVAASLGVEGTLRIDSLRRLPDIDPRDDAAVRLDIAERDGKGRYRIAAACDKGGIQATVDVEEAPDGLIAHLAGLPAIGAITAHLSADGPREGLQTQVAITAGGLKAQAHGNLDAVHGAANMTLSATAPAMAPAPDLSWQAISLDARIDGPFSGPRVQARVRMDALSAAGATIGTVFATAAGDKGSVRTEASLNGLRLPGPKPDLFEAAPVAVEAEARLDAADRPVTFAVRHPLLSVTGSARTANAMSAEATLSLPDLAPFAAAGSVDLHGHAALKLHASQSGDREQVEADGKIGITDGLAPLPALVGDDATIGAAATLHGSDIALSRLTLDGRALRVSASGSLAGEQTSARADVDLTDLSGLAPQLAGALSVRARAEGRTSALAAHVDLSGNVAARGMASGPLTATLDAEGLPNAPSGRLTAQGSLLGSPVDLAANARREAGEIALTIDRATWKSLHAEGAATLPAGASIPQGRITLAMTRLEDLAPLIGQRIGGSLTASLDADADRARFNLEARNAGLPGTASAARAVLAATVTQPATHPAVDATLTVDGVSASGLAGSARMQVRGPQDALAVRVDATLPVLAGGPASLSGGATIDAAGKAATLSALQAAWKGETLRLLGPARVGFGDGVSVDRLRLGLRQAVLELTGRVSPTMDLTASLRGLPVDIAAIVVPGFAADGSVRADARLTGPTSRPSGTVSVAASGVRMRSGPGQALPPASLDARAALAAGAARVDAALAAGATRLTLAGQAPLGAGTLDLRAGGTLDLAMLDPILAANGRRVRGRVALDATIGGTMAAPVLSGTVRLSDGEVQDFAQGLHLTGMTAQLRAQGDTVRIEQFHAVAAPGTIDAGGTVGVLAPGIPVDLTLTARNARPLSSDLMTAQMNADLTLRGQVLGGQGQGGMALGGTVFVQRAEIRIPERLPSSVPVLNVRVAGQKPPPPPPPPPDVALDLTVDAPEQIFVRGRGLDAELGGKVHLAGSTTNLQPSGGFNLRRGTFSLAGQTLSFSKGEVGFAGAGLTDPSIDFVANSTNGSITATLEVAGTARAPKITLTSIPELPQDEVLAQLLFGRSASSLGPFELAQIAAALASLTGVAPGAGDPLGGVRQALGLDRLSVASGTKGGPALEAGRYVARNVYVGVRQGAAGGDSQAQVQVDLMKGLKLQGTVGTSSRTTTGSTTYDPTGDSGSSIGLTYQFEY
jgi:translocation and assembly module TamB